MNPGSPTSQNSPDRQRSLKIEDYEAFLELLPHAAFLLESQENRILLANSKVAELTLYTRAELDGLEPGVLFPNWDINEVLNSLNNSGDLGASGAFENKNNRTLIRRNQTRTSVQLFPVVISFLLLFFKQLVNPSLKLTYCLIRVCHNFFC